MLRKLARRLNHANVAAAVALLLATGLPAGCAGDDEKQTGGTGDAGLGARFARASATVDSAAKPYTPTGPLIADSGFRPEKDGFAFENYARGFQDLTLQELQDLFGPDVCASGRGANCVLKPAAQEWMNTMNQAMGGGHCNGLSVLANMMFDRLSSPLDYGGQTPPALALAGNSALQSQIAEAWTHQVLDRVRATRISGTPNQVLDALINGLNNHPDTYTLSLRDRQNTSGHTVNPYAVEDKGDGKLAILIYDSNYPGIRRAVEVDRNQNTWNYELQPNPEEQSLLFEGDAVTQTMSLRPTSPGLGVHPCPFCATPGNASRPVRSLKGTGKPRRRAIQAGRYEQVSLAGDTVNHAHIVITDRRGRKTGVVGGRLRNEIPGIEVVHLERNQNFRERPEPIYLVPRGRELSVTLDGSSLRATDDESLTVIGPGYSAVVSDIAIRPGDRHRVEVRGNGRKLVYRSAAGRSQSPDIQIGLERPGRAVRFAVAAHEMKPGSVLMASVARSARALRLDGDGVKNARASAVIGFTELLPTGARVVQHRATPLGPATSCRFRGARGGACREAGR